MLGFQSELFKQRDITASQDGIMSEVATLNTTQTNAQNREGTPNGLQPASSDVLITTTKDVIWLK